MNWTLQKLSDNLLYEKLSKTDFALTSIEYLDHHIYDDKLFVDPVKVTRI